VLENKDAGYRGHGAGTPFGRSQGAEDWVAARHLTHWTGVWNDLAVGRPVGFGNHHSRWLTVASLVYGTCGPADRIRGSGGCCMGGGIVVGTFTESNGSQRNCLPVLVVLLHIFSTERRMVLLRQQPTFSPFRSSVFSVPTRGSGRRFARRFRRRAAASRRTATERWA